REEHDPIEQVRRRVLEARLVSEDELKAIDADVRTIINAAAEFAQNDVEPAEGELWTDVLVPAWRASARWCFPAGRLNLEDEEPVATGRHSEPGWGACSRARSRRGTPAHMHRAGHRAHQCHACGLAMTHRCPAH